jgi:predicted 3-demethylubiquinone-9 3-methyltransferase (glyoxalase superfamily)
VNFELNGKKFMGLNGGPQFNFTEAVSFVVDCETQEEIDYYWNRLTEGGQESMCGWLKDKFGVSWQIVPAVLGKLMSDPEKGQRVIQAFLKMKKFDIKALENA